MFKLNLKIAWRNLWKNKIYTSINVIGLALGGTTGYAINPARDLGPRIMHSILPVKGSSDWGYAWIPVIAPLTGAVLAALLYLALQ